MVVEMKTGCCSNPADASSSLFAPLIPTRVETQNRFQGLGEEKEVVISQVDACVSENRKMVK